MPEPQNRNIRLAVLQPDLTPGAAMPNLIALRRTAEELAAAAPIDLLVLPEIFDGCSIPPEGVDPSVAARQFLRNLARACSTNVIGGSIDRVIDSHHRNTTYVMNRDGEEVGAYDKRILFSTEQNRRTPGQGIGVFQLDDFRVGILICADLWWPELTREIYDQIDLLCVPCKTGVLSEKYEDYARTLWHSLALTRATENGCAIAVSDWSAGPRTENVIVDGARTQQRYHTAGASIIVDPGHRPDLTRMLVKLDQGQPGAIRADINLDRLADYRKYRTAVGLLPEPRPEAGNP